MKAVNEFDLAFVVDTTRSMSSLIHDAKRYMSEMLESVVGKSSIDLRLGVVEYRDHPPQEHTFAAKHYPFCRGNTARNVISQLSLGCGGDYPESVFDGIKSACIDLQWRKHARRIGVLLGDAPPHGMTKTGQEGQCTCGLSFDEVTTLAEEHAIKFYGIALTQDVMKPFGLLCSLTGGECFDSGRNPMDRLKSILLEEFADVDLDRQVLGLWKPGVESRSLAAEINVSAQKIILSLGRLRQRELIGV